MGRSIFATGDGWRLIKENAAGFHRFEQRVARALHSSKRTCTSVIVKVQSSLDRGGTGQCELGRLALAFSIAQLGS